MLLGIIPGVLIQEHNHSKVLERLNLLKDSEISLEIVQIDGGVNFETIKLLLDAGATELVCGSSTIYKNVDLRDNQAKRLSIRENINTIKEIVNV